MFRIRFVLERGSSHDAQVRSEHAVAYGKPLTRIRETVVIVRELIREGQVHFEGKTIRIENSDRWYTPRRRDVPGGHTWTKPRGKSGATERGSRLHRYCRHRL